MIIFVGKLTLCHESGPVLTALIIPFLGTALGSAFVFFMKREMPPLVQKVLLGFALGFVLMMVLDVVLG